MAGRIRSAQTLGAAVIAGRPSDCGRILTRSEKDSARITVSYFAMDVQSARREWEVLSLGSGCLVPRQEMISL